MHSPMYYIIYGVMLLSFATLSVGYMPTPREKAIGILITILNGLLYWR